MTFLEGITLVSWKKYLSSLRDSFSWLVYFYRSFVPTGQAKLIGENRKVKMNLGSVERKAIPRHFLSCRSGSSVGMTNDLFCHFEGAFSATEKSHLE
jgi:hypothetical protein